ncbi:MAG: sulfite exporter TauE/SafE family protein [candidate division NC10 bacterium]
MNSFVWALGALVVAVASFVMGLTGFGIGLVSLAFLPFLMPPATAVAVVTIYAAAFALAIFVPLRRDFLPRGVADLVIGTIVGTPLGVWALASLPASALNRLIGLMLLVAVLLEWRGLYPDRLAGRGWGLGTGVLAGAIGGAVGTPGPPVILYATTQGWSPRTIKANVQAFFVVNQVVILAGYWWAGLLTREVWRLTAVFAVPAIVGVALGVALFNRVDHVRFRRIVFALLFVSGAVLLARG